MPSFKARILSWIIWWWFKSTWSSAEGINNRISKERLRPERVPPKHLYKEFAVEEYKRKGHIADYFVYIVSPKTETPTRGRILYLHGGGFVFDITPQHWESLSKFIQRPWFRRLWIRQEVQLASRVLVRCGNAEIEWEKIEKAIVFVEHRISRAYVKTEDVLFCRSLFRYVGSDRYVYILR